MNKLMKKGTRLAPIPLSLLKQYGLSYLASPGSGLQRVAMVIHTQRRTAFAVLKLEFHPHTIEVGTSCELQ